VRLQLHALAYNLANFLRTLALPSLQKPSDGGYAACQIAGLAGHIGTVGW
jgi:hypothetical protein